MLCLPKGFKGSCISWGKRGDAGRCSDKLFFEAQAVKPVDTTAAGAAFTAAMVNGLAQGMGIIQAIRLANGVASIVVTRHGAQTSIPDREEVGDLIRNY